RWNGRGVPRRTQRPDGGTAALFADRAGDGHARASGDTAAGAARGAAVHTRRASRLRQGAGAGRAAVRRRLKPARRKEIPARLIDTGACQEGRFRVWALVAPPEYRTR